MNNSAGVTYWSKLSPTENRGDIRTLPADLVGRLICVRTHQGEE